MHAARFAAIVVASAAAGSFATFTVQTSALHSTVFDWSTADTKPNAWGAVRQIVRERTPTLDELEIHVSTLKPGLSPHAPHQHQNEELLIVKEGTLETFQSGATRRVGPGGIIFQASNEMHNVTNVGQSPATYYVIAWTVPGATKTAMTPAPWRALFNGSSLDAWRGYKTDKIPDGWHNADGTLAKDRPVADIVSKEEFGDFELELEWKIGEAGNSGIFYRGTEEYDHIYWSAPEYQLLDDVKGADNKTRLTCAGAAYAVYPSPPGHLKPVGEWNAARIVARGPHIEHWLNGVKVVDYELGSPDWEAKVKASKFSAWPNYGRAKRGHIALQGDHEGSLGFRNIRIRELR